MNKLKIINTTVKLDIKKQIKFLHITDSHIFRDDTSGWNRKAEFDKDFDGCAEEYFCQAIQYAKERNMPIIHTGDIIDFLSFGNFEFLEKAFPKKLDYIFAVGNHDFVDFADIQKGQQENKEYKERQMNTIAKYIKNNLYFSSILVGDVNVVTIDNSLYQITDGQLDMLKAEVAKGLPIILCMHIPLFAPGLAQAAQVDWCPKVTFTLGAPDEVLATYQTIRFLSPHTSTAIFTASSTESFLLLWAMMPRLY